jgi:hypothetical protein
VLAIVLLMALHIFQQQIYSFYNPINYVSIHTLLESFSISISAAIFLYGVKKYQQNYSSRMLLLVFTFLIVGTLDLFHTLSFKGMPFFITESSVAKATWFWVAARAIQSLCILAILLVPDHHLKKDYRFLAITAGSLTVLMASFFIIHFEKSLPILVIEGKGTTFLKNIMEYSISFIQFISLIIALYQYTIEKRESNLAIALAFVFLLLTELVFTVYQSVFDLTNFSGHIFKAVGFYFILKAFYFENKENNSSEQEHLPSFNNLPGFIFRAVKRGNDFIFTACHGDLLQDKGIMTEDLIGQRITQVFSTNIDNLKEYCHLAVTMQENIQFEMDVMENTFLISIKPVYDTPLEEVIIGTVMDMTGINTESTKALKQEDRIFVKQ